MLNYITFVYVNLLASSHCAIHLVFADLVFSGMKSLSRKWPCIFVNLVNNILVVNVYNPGSHMHIHTYNCTHINVYVMYILVYAFVRRVYASLCINLHLIAYVHNPF